MNNQKQHSSDVLYGYWKYGWVIPFLMILFCTVFLILRRVDETNSQAALSKTIIAAAPAQDDSQLMVRFEDIEIPPTIIENKVMADPPVFISYGGKVYKELKNGLYEDAEGGLWKKIKVSTTAYTWVDDGYDPSIGAGDGITSIGKCAIKTYGIAADPKAIPYGSVIHVAGYGVYKVDDTGGAMRKSYRKGEIRLDLRIPQKASNGQWRNISTCRNIAKRHGYQPGREVLLKIR